MRGSRAAAARWRVLAWGVARASVMLAAMSAVFFSLWTVHIALLPYSGQGDGFASPAYAATLYEKPAPGPPADAAAAATDALACPNPMNTWSDCGFSPMTEAQCLERGCCWDPTSNKVRAWRGARRGEAAEGRVREAGGRARHERRAACDVRGA